MKSEGSLKLEIESNEKGEFTVDVTVKVGAVESGLQLFAEDETTARDAIRDLITEDLDNLINRSFDSLTSEEYKLQCPHCCKPFAASFKEGTPSLIACPFDGCGGTIIVESHEEVY